MCIYHEQYGYGLMTDTRSVYQSSYQVRPNHNVPSNIIRKSEVAYFTMRFQNRSENREQKAIIYRFLFFSSSITLNSFFF